MMLCGNPLPWTDTCKYLVVHIGNTSNGCEEGMRSKNAEYVKKIDKQVLKMLQRKAVKDKRSVTGSNYRNIMFLIRKTRVEDVRFQDSHSLTYHQLNQAETWTISAIKEIINTKAGMMEVPGFEIDELEEILNHL